MLSLGLRRATARRVVSGAPSVVFASPLGAQDSGHDGVMRRVEPRAEQQDGEMMNAAWGQQGRVSIFSHPGYIQHRSFAARGPMRAGKTRAETAYARDINTHLFNCRSVRDFEEAFLRIDDFDSTNVAIALFRLSKVRGAQTKIPPGLVKMLEERLMSLCMQNPRAVSTKSLVHVIGSFASLAFGDTYLCSPDMWVKLQCLLRDRYLDQVQGLRLSNLMRSLVSMGKLSDEHGALPKLVDGIVESLMTGDKLAQDFKGREIVRMIFLLANLRKNTPQAVDPEALEGDDPLLTVPGSQEEQMVIKADKVVAAATGTNPTLSGADVMPKPRDFGQSAVLPLAVYYAIDLQMANLTPYELGNMVRTLRFMNEMVPVGFAQKLMLTFVEKLPEFQSHEAAFMLSVCTSGRWMNGSGGWMPMPVPEVVRRAVYDHINLSELSCKQLADLFWQMPSYRLADGTLPEADLEIFRQVQDSLAQCIPVELVKMEGLLHGESPPYNELRQFSFSIYRIAWSLTSMMDNGVSRELYGALRDSTAFLMANDAPVVRPVTMCLLAFARMLACEGACEEFMDDELLALVEPFVTLHAADLGVHDAANIIEAFNAMEKLPSAGLLEKLPVWLEMVRDPTVLKQNEATSIADALLAISSIQRHAGEAGSAPFLGAANMLYERFEGIADTRPEDVQPVAWARALWSMIAMDHPCGKFVLENAEESLRKGLEQLSAPSNIELGTGRNAMVFAQMIWSFAKLGHTPDAQTAAMVVTHFEQGLLPVASTDKEAPVSDTKDVFNKRMLRSNMAALWSLSVFMEELGLESGSFVSADSLKAMERFILENREMLQNCNLDQYINALTKLGHSPSSELQQLAAGNQSAPVQDLEYFSYHFPLVPKHQD